MVDRDRWDLVAEQEDGMIFVSDLHRSNGRTIKRWKKGCLSSIGG